MLNPSEIYGIEYEPWFQRLDEETKYAFRRTLIALTKEARFIYVLTSTDIGMENFVTSRNVHMDVAIAHLLGANYSSKKREMEHYEIIAFADNILKRARLKFIELLDNNSLPKNL